METYFGKPEENNLSDDINEALAAELLKGKTYNSSEISLLENNIPVLPRAHPAEWGIPLLKEKLLFFLDKQPKRTPFIV